MTQQVYMARSYAAHIAEASHTYLVLSPKTRLISSARIRPPEAARSEAVCVRTRYVPWPLRATRVGSSRAGSGPDTTFAEVARQAGSSLQRQGPQPHSDTPIGPCARSFTTLLLMVLDGFQTRADSRSGSHCLPLADDCTRAGNPSPLGVRAVKRSPELRCNDKPIKATQWNAVPSLSLPRLRHKPGSSKQPLRHPFTHRER